MFKLRDYQIELSDKAKIILDKYKIILLYMEVRTWKTITSLEIARKFWAKKILFVTKKKAISSIEWDYKYFDDHYEMQIINYESLHKIEDKDFDLVILDEVHWTLSWYPKPSRSHKSIKQRFSHLPFILLSGTPLIESASKIFHQLSISKSSPFNNCVNFYKWHRIYWIPKTIYTNYWEAKDYSQVRYDEVVKEIDHLMVTYTQKEAGVTTEITETVLNVKMKDQTYSLIKQLMTDRVIESPTDELIADTWVKLQICLHQMYSGTIKLESWNAVILDRSKANFIKEYFKGKKIAIMYCFVKEKQLLQEVLWDLVTDNLEEFKTSKKSYIWQIVSNREWISLREADALVFYNIAFSWTSYVQWRDRLSYMWRKENNVYFINSENGIEEKILKTVRKKQNFTSKIFEKTLC